MEKKEVEGESEDALTELKQRSDLLKLLRDEVRLSIVINLFHYPKLSFQQIVQLTNRSKSTVSHHIKLLTEGGVLQEVDVGPDEKSHGKEKYYGLNKVLLGDFPADKPASLSKNDWQEITLNKFDYGRFYFLFMKRLLNQVNDYVQDLFDDLLELEEDDASDTEAWDKKLDEMELITQLSRFFAFPLPDDQFDVLMERMYNVVVEFSNEYQKSTEFDESKGLNWVMGVGLPFTKLKQLRDQS